MAENVVPLVRNAHEWTGTKLDFLELYLPAFVRATRKARSRYYVDGFAGPGRNVIEGVERDGSPLIALNAADAFSGYHFVEFDAPKFRSLQQHVQRHERSELVRLHQGDFNDAIEYILPEIPSRSPTLFLLDPEGLELKFSTIERIAAREKADLFVLVSASGVARNLDQPHVHPLIDSFLGGPGWQDAYERFRDGTRPGGQTRFEFIMQYYLARLADLGFEVTEYILASNSKRVPLHALVFAVKSDKPGAALHIASDVVRRLRSRNQTPLF